MNKIINKQQLSSNVYKMDIQAAEIAQKRKAGQFIILKIDENGERIPLTIANADPNNGTITIIYQVVGKTTFQLSQLNIGDHILDVAGPLGKPTHIENIGTVVCIGGGIGVAPLYPIAQAMKNANNNLISIIGARDKDLIILENEMRNTSSELHIVTDNGSKGNKGFVTDALNDLINKGIAIDLVVAIGPPIMMKMVSTITRPYNIKTIVSLNTIMIDGTGMCGGCRVTVGNKTKFVCVDGPEFDGHLVDFDEMMRRQKMYESYEKKSNENHNCKIGLNK